MIESLILIQGENVSEEALGSTSLVNAKQLVIGSTPGGDVVLHVAANSSADFGKALIALATNPGVMNILTLAIQIPR